MKTTIFSQKHSSDHAYSTTYTNISYPQQNGNFPKKSAITKKFEYSIALNTVQSHKPSRDIHCYPFSNDQHNLISLSSISPHIMKPKKPTQKPVQIETKNPLAETFIKEYQKIINNLEHYYKFYEWSLQKEIQSQNQYLDQVINMIKEQKKKSSLFMVEQIKVLEQRITLQIGALQNKISLLNNNNVNHYEKQMEQLRSQQTLEIPLFQLKFLTAEKLKEQIKKITFSITTTELLEKELNQTHSIDNTICLEESIKTEKKERTPLEDITALELEQMTPIHFQSDEPIQPFKPVNTLQDKDLYCDQDIENILKENKIVRKKRYECRQDPIPEESQSHEDSGIIQADALS